VWVVARVHPGETASSFVVEGMAKYLVWDDEKAKLLRQKYIFKIVPMVNIDGVVHGNSCAELSGVDPGRQWAAPSKTRAPMIWAMKKLIEKDAAKVEMFLELRSRPGTMGTVFHGNSFEGNELLTRKYPSMVCAKDERFDYASCTFGDDGGGSRRVLFELLQIPHIYTVDSSSYGYRAQGNRITEYLPNDYRAMGAILL
jgi:hypothetical protein